MRTVWCPPPPPPLGNPPPPGGHPSHGPKSIENIRRQRKFLPGAEADLHCDTMVQICGAPPPPPPGGGNRHIMTAPPPPLGGNRPDKRGEIAMRGAGVGGEGHSKAGEATRTAGTGNRRSGWQSVRMAGSDNKGDGLASQPRGYRVQGQPLLNRHQVGGVSRSPDGLFAQQEREPIRGRPAMRGKRTYGGRPGQRMEEQVTHTETQRGRLRTACGQRRVDSKNSQTTPATTSTSSIRQLLGAADTQTAHHATFSTAPTHQPLGTANAETTPARAPAAAGDRKQRPDATREGKNG